MDNTLRPPESLAQFQQSFSQQLKDPDQRLSLKRIPARPAQIYRELVFNNVCGFIDQCFPVAQTLLGDEAWSKLKTDFFQQHRCHSPLFNHIPREFASYIKASSKQTPWLSDLLHYEWVELEVDLDTGEVPPAPQHVNPDCRITCNPTLQCLEYSWPVHRLCREYLPSEPETTHLAIFRSNHHNVHFIELNALTFQMLRHIQASVPSDLEELLISFHKTVPNLDWETIKTFGSAILLDLLSQNVLIIDA